MALPRIALSANNMTSLFLLNREADDMFSMCRGNTDFVLTASFEEYTKCLKEFVIPNKLMGSFLYMFPHTSDVSVIMSNSGLLTLCFMGDMAHALAKDACIASSNLSSLSNIEWTGLSHDELPNHFTAEQLKAAKTKLLGVLEKAEYNVNKRLRQAPYSRAIDVATLAYATVQYISNAWNFTVQL